MTFKTFHQYLNETTLSRVWSHAENPLIPIGLMSASRKGMPDAVKHQKTLDLAADVRNEGYGYFFVDGHYTEAGGPVEETSVFIVGAPQDNGRLKGLMRRWLHDYSQESVLFKPEGSNRGVLLTDAGTELDIGVMHPNRVGEMMTKLRGRGDRPFVFESAYESMSFFGRLLAKVRATG
jgi:hypothetical protein